MRILTAPFFFLGRIFLWVFLLPVGIWRSLVHHRKKGQRKAIEEMRKDLKQNPQSHQ